MTSQFLAGIRVLDLSRLLPGPFLTMVLADLGADVVRVERPGGGLQVGAPERDVVLRNRRSVAADVKTPEGLEWALLIYAQARPTYHPVAVNTIDQVRKWEEAAKAGS